MSKQCKFSLPFLRRLPNEYACLTVETWLQPGTVKRKNGRVTTHICYVSPDGKRKQVVAAKKGRGTLRFKYKRQWMNSRYKRNSLMKSTLDAAFGEGWASVGTVMEANESNVWEKVIRMAHHSHDALQNVCDVMRA